ncbi:DUF2971 domain-containing protein [Phascolarctobacterium succinatutens]|uniref:DUF2971 domain-containing protein n=1 Tax=Phascolarctobacterium succinatutens TaxID=626940 RepID=UPI0026EC2509|nr:DUF2971 domain-containing protein [Phascolarctobacterium succinatutens]
MINQNIIEEVFHKEYIEKLLGLKSNELKLAHYTSARVALSLIENKTIWLNNIQYMNDYSEIKIGNTLLADYYNNETGNEIKEVIEEINHGIKQNLELSYNNNLSRLMNTYAFCLTEHSKEEDDYGRLSMWRAYAPKNGVAIVLDTDVFTEEAFNTKVATIPMFYLKREEFIDAVSDFANRLEKYKDDLKYLPNFSDLVLRKFIITALSMKHKGFQEEREWRVIYNDIFSNVNENDIVTENIEEINGELRIIKKLDFSQIRYGNCPFDMNKLIYRIIIGPSNNPEQLRTIFIHTLEKNGVIDAANKVVCSDIPVRI